MLKNKYIFSMLASVLVAFGFVALTTYSATTISTNVNTGGTLTVTGLSTLGYASTTGVSLTGNLMVNGFATTTGSNGNMATNGTLTVTGLSTLAGFLTTASSTAVGMFSVSGPLNASSTMAVTGISYFYGNINVNGVATTTATNGNFASAGTITASSTIGVATTTPATEISASSNATTTVYLSSTAAGKGGCLELLSATGTPWRMYIGASDYATSSTGNGGTLRSSTGANAVVYALWEQGACK